MAKTAHMKHQNKASMAKTVDEQNERTSTSQGDPTVVLMSNSIESDDSSPSKWVRCNEDLLRNKITSLEAQLQLCLQRLPKDGLKKLVMQMERQKLAYEQKALAALQKTTLEKTEALAESHSLQEALKTAKAEVSRWQSLFEEQKQTSMHLKDCHEHTSGQVEELHSQLELSRSQQAELRAKTASLQQVHEEMQHNISLLEGTNQMLSNDIHLKASTTESCDFAVQVYLPAEESGKDQREEEEAEEDEEEDEESAVVQELCYTQERLRTKERECVDLEAELEATQQEYRSSQARLTHRSLPWTARTWTSMEALPLWDPHRPTLPVRHLAVVRNFTFGKIVNGVAMPLPPPAPGLDDMQGIKSLTSSQA
ncbi:hypothetical protein CRUP_034087 [Coryphaenoides rupestris]|nr:hypothetical protein CRUP_034087 [Coryphaenoides rupestris]